jgi:cardiolipin synthase
VSQIVAIPVNRMSAKVVLEKGRGWSAVDELVLWALSRAPMSAAAVAEKSRLPRRVIIEIIIRMMRFRLVEAVLVDGVPAFQSTDRGSAVVASGSHIPTAKRRMSRNVSFVVDRITGTVFSKSDVRLDQAAGIQFLRNKGIDVRDVEVSGAVLKTSPKENVIRFQKVLRRDETLLFFDGDTVMEPREDEYMIVTVDGEAVGGVPDNTPHALLQQIRLVAGSTATARPIVVASLLRDEDESLLPALRAMQFDDGDVIFDGPEHRRAFADVIGAASRRILLHSTFLRKDGFLAWRHEFRAAVRRGTLIDIFWGSGTAEKPGEKTIVEATVSAFISGRPARIRSSWSLTMAKADTSPSSDRATGFIPGSTALNYRCGCASRGWWRTFSTGSARLSQNPVSSQRSVPSFSSLRGSSGSATL